MDDRNNGSYRMLLIVKYSCHYILGNFFGCFRWFLIVVAKTKIVLVGSTYGMESVYRPDEVSLPERFVFAAVHEYYCASFPALFDRSIYTLPMFSAGIGNIESRHKKYRI
jgi:hypothetical protein